MKQEENGRHIECPRFSAHHGSSAASLMAALGGKDIRIRDNPISTRRSACASKIHMHPELRNDLPELPPPIMTGWRLAEPVVRRNMCGEAEWNISLAPAHSCTGRRGRVGWTNPKLICRMSSGCRCGWQAGRAYMPDIMVGVG